MDVCGSMGPVGFHLWVLRELADVIEKQLGVIMVSGRVSQWQEEKYHFYLQEGREGKFRELQARQPHLSSWERDGENPPGEVIVNWAVAFYSEMTTLVDKGKDVSVVFLSYSKAFGTIFLNIVIDNCPSSLWFHSSFKVIQRLRFG